MVYDIRNFIFSYLIDEMFESKTNKQTNKHGRKFSNSVTGIYIFIKTFFGSIRTIALNLIFGGARDFVSKSKYIKTDF